MVDLSDDEGGEEGGASKTKKEEPEDLGIPNVAVGFFFYFPVNKEDCNFDKVCSLGSVVNATC